MTNEASWIADGTSEAEPVTTETPVDPTETEAVALEAGEVDPVETTEVDEATVTSDVPVDDVTEVAEIVENFIEGRVGDDVFQIPDGLLVPQTRGGETSYEPLAEVLDRGMKGNDYRLKTTELANMRRELDSRNDEFARREARMEARSKYVEEREGEIKAALTDPKSAAAYEEHLAQYQNNPMYRENVDKALSHREVEAERDELQQREDGRIVREASNLALGWIDDLKSEYASVDPERVRSMYARQLSAGEAALDISAVRSIYQAEQDYVNRTVSPLQDQLADITAQLKVLQDGAAADQHNETTQHAVQRAKTKPVATGSGAPTKVAVAAGKFGPHELQDRNSKWIRAG